MARLLARTDSVWFSLQVGGTGPELGRLVQGGKITDLGAQIGNFMDTAQAIARLDLVIAVDTAVAHLAGALGKPVWLLLPFEAEWRWLLDRADSPWYPTMRLFRQNRQGDWAEVVARVAAALADFKPPGH
jgi:ADP-heptose:LPS heptosyltransferase